MDVLFGGSCFSSCWLLVAVVIGCGCQIHPPILFVSGSVANCDLPAFQKPDYLLKLRKAESRCEPEPVRTGTRLNQNLREPIPDLPARSQAYPIQPKLTQSNGQPTS